jgi:aminopeptidase YwaD
MVPLFDGEKAYKHIKVLADEIGDRPAGSENDRNAMNYIKTYFDGLGLDISVQEYPVKTAITLDQGLWITKTGEALECAAMPMRGTTGTIGVTGLLLYLESTDEEYLTPDVAGKIILTDDVKGSSHEYFRKHKPLGIIVHESKAKTKPQHYYGNISDEQPYGEWATVRVSYDTAQRLVKENVGEVKLLVDSEKRDEKSYNIVAEVKGSKNPDEIVLVGGHYDSMPGIDGASDNAAGTAMVMELARIFSETGCDRTLRFIAFGNEEMGIYGSYNYAQKLKQDKDEAEKVKLCVNIDVQGSYVGKNCATFMGPPELKDSVTLLAKESGIVFETKEELYDSDGLSFSSLGIPSVSYARRSGIDVMMHTVEDTIEHLGTKPLDDTGKFIEKWLRRYTSTPSFPFERKVPEKLMDQVEGFYKEWGMARP